ncbi:polar amino acid transport system substrate-binding protein [Paraburkholderia sp. BL27I4N3]|uniref:substrate-binding periplasmic protein n=1 Tax=Paraburkholderia sp. BL27I4N3 TaxID=1938805 RepID=UPI000E267850|nr:transporter substrate-binding domain-containing protein [Paraburkholderia sp. BL27I4N3]REE18146.1 polar amino acid transport system substrate-binding protein [Paraburkholderia sp. BL27I4N3]
MKYSALKISYAALVLSGVLTAQSVFAAGCTPAHKFDTVAPGTLTVSTISYPPFDNVQDEKFVGVDAEILKRFAENECLTVKAAVADDAASLQYVVSGRADISSASWYRTEKRAQVMGVSDPLYLELMGIYTKEGTKKLNDLQGKTIGTVQGYLWVPELQAIFGDKLKLYPNPVAMAQDLQTGRIDAAVDTYTAGIEAQKKGGFKGFKITVADPDDRVRSSVKPAQTGFLYNKSNAALGAALNATIDEMQKNGEIAKILKSYGLNPDASKVGDPRYADAK